MRSASTAPARPLGLGVLAVAALGVVAVSGPTDAVGQPAGQPVGARAAAGSGADTVVAASSQGIRPAAPPLTADGGARSGAPEAPAEPTEESMPTPSPVVGEVDGVELRSVSAQALAVGYHEARGNRLPITPIDANAGVEPVVMPSRNRGGAPTSAVDIAVPQGETILAPVSGTVVEVADYTLYGSTPDVLVVIAPEGRPNLHVEVLHLENAQVESGDHVAAGVTPIAGASRLLPFPSQVDRFSGAATPHVHLTVKPV